MTFSLAAFHPYLTFDPWASANASRDERHSSLYVAARSTPMLLGSLEREGSGAAGCEWLVEALGGTTRVSIGRRAVHGIVRALWAHVL